MRIPTEDDIITTIAELMQATAEQRRRWRDALLDEWQANRARELAEDDRADAERGDWGD